VFESRNDIRLIYALFQEFKNVLAHLIHHDQDVIIKVHHYSFAHTALKTK
jgi:hypothetical protein